MRLLAHAEGPLIHACQRAGLEVQQVDARRLLSATTVEALEDARHALQRAVWWGHLDVVATFEPDCAWALDAARCRRIAAVADLSRPAGTAPYPPVVVEHMEAAVQTVDRVCFASPVVSATVATGQPAAIIPPWPGPAGAKAPPRPAAEESVWRRALGLLAALEPRIGSVPVCCLNLSRDCPEIRPLLDAAHANHPIISVASPVVADYFRPHEIALLANDEPRVLAHALLDLANNPTAAARRAEAARRRVLGMPDRATLLNRWLAWLEGAVTHGSGPAAPAHPQRTKGRQSRRPGVL